MKEHIPAFRELPYSVDSEQALLCSLLLSQDEVGDLCTIGLKAGAFFIPTHQIIYDAVQELRSKSRAADFVTLKDFLSDRGLLETVGGPENLSKIFAFVPSPANATFYLDIVSRKHLLRELISTCAKLSAKAYDTPDEVDPLMDEAESAIFAITDSSGAKESTPIKELAMEALRVIEAVSNNGQMNGLATGFKELDAMVNGLHPSEMFVIAARPSMGKTALAMNIADHVAIDQQKPVAVFSLEMGAEQLTMRLIGCRAGVDLQKMRLGFLSNPEKLRLAKAAKALGNSPLFIEDAAGISINELRAKARRLKSKHGIVLIIIDYLQLLSSSSRRARENRQIEISEISAGIKNLAKELKIPIIVTAQLNRQVDARAKEGGRPRLSDLRESGSIEQDADVVGLLLRPEYYNDDIGANGAGAEGEATLIIGKQRNGPTGDIPLTFLKQFTRFENRAEKAY